MFSKGICLVCWRLLCLRYEVSSNILTPFLGQFYMCFCHLLCLAGQLKSCSCLFCFWAEEFFWRTPFKEENFHRDDSVWLLTGLGYELGWLYVDCAIVNEATNWGFLVPCQYWCTIAHTSNIYQLLFGIGYHYTLGLTLPRQELLLPSDYWAVKQDCIRRDRARKLASEKYLGLKWSC